MSPVRICVSLGRQNIWRARDRRRDEQSLIARQRKARSAAESPALQAEAEPPKEEEEEEAALALADLAGTGSQICIKILAPREPGQSQESAAGPNRAPA